MENKLHILLCEDEESLGMLVREYLQAKGYDAELYLDGEAGYKAFVKGKSVFLKGEALPFCQGMNNLGIGFNSGNIKGNGALATA